MLWLKGAEFLLIKEESDNFSYTHQESVWMEMLSSLDDLAGKVSPGSGKDSPQHFDSNANVAAAAKLRHLNHIVHPYSRQDAANNAAKEKWVNY